MCPSLGTKLSCFIALAPAVYAGPLTTGFPFTALSRLEWSTWKRFFGVLDFIPLMRWAYDYAPAKLFVRRRPSHDLPVLIRRTGGFGIVSDRDSGRMTILMIVASCSLFSSAGPIPTGSSSLIGFRSDNVDHRRLHRRKTKMFRFTPTPVSSASIFWYVLPSFTRPLPIRYKIFQRYARAPLIIVGGAAKAASQTGSAHSMIPSTSGLTTGSLLFRYTGVGGITSSLLNPCWNGWSIRRRM